MAAAAKKAKMGPDELAAEAERKAAVLAAKQARQWARAAKQEPDAEQAGAIASAIASQMSGGSAQDPQAPKRSLLDYAAAAAPAAAPPAAAAPAAATRAPGRFRGAERAWGSTKELLDDMPQTAEVTAAAAAAAAAAAKAAVAAAEEEEERRASDQRRASDHAAGLDVIDDKMAYGRRGGLSTPGRSPPRGEVSPSAMRAKAAANGLATPTSLNTSSSSASLRTGQPKPKVGSVEWMQTVDKARRTSNDNDRSSAKRLEF